MYGMYTGAPLLPPPSTKPIEFKSGDSVKVQLETDVFKIMQDGHGGWNDQMSEVG